MVLHGSACQAQHCMPSATLHAKRAQAQIWVWQSPQRTRAAPGHLASTSKVLLAHQEGVDHRHRHAPNTEGLPWRSWTLVIWHSHTHGPLHPKHP